MPRTHLSCEKGKENGPKMEHLLRATLRRLLPHSPGASLMRLGGIHGSYLETTVPCS